MRSAFGFLALGMAVWAQSPAGIDNDQVNVTTVVDPPNSKSKMHEHARNRAMIYLDEGAQRITYDDGRVQTTQFRPGQVEWSPAGGRHISENTGGTPYRLVKVELKRSGGNFQAPPLDPVRVHPSAYKTEFENADVRVVRVGMQPREKIPLHEHVLNRVVVFLTPARIRVTPEGGQPTEVTAAAADVRFSNPGKHTEENAGDTPVEVLMVEVK